MTSADVVRTVEILLDDGLDYHPNLARRRLIDGNEVIRAIDEAQLKIIHKSYTMGDERALRPLYAHLTGLSYGDALSQTYIAYYQKPIYPRVCRLRNKLVEDETQGIVYAEYLPYEIYINHIHPDYVNGTRLPRTAVYTFKESFNPITSRMETLLLFSGDVDKTEAEIWYLQEPVPFGYLPGGNRKPFLTLPEEYHYAVCAKAAEILLDLDVGETERGATAFQNQRLTIDTTGGPGDDKLQ